MRRPTEQGKLLFLYLLRSSAAALATTSSRPSTSFSASTTAAAAAATNHARTATAPPARRREWTPLQATTTAVDTEANGVVVQREEEAPSRRLDGVVTLRLARRSDVAGIQRCNLATLPENYNPTFYTQHMRQWPDLALVAEHVPARLRETADSTTPSPLHSLGAFDPNAPENDKQIVGYVLGKVEESHHPDEERLGHVTSLAILHEFRRQGLALELMNQLHYLLQESYGAHAVGLHVRVSNAAAVRLYVSSALQYKVAQVIDGYYQDGEDAYLMRREFPTRQPRNGLWQVLRRRPWENGLPQYRLPRDIPLQPQQQQQPHHDKESTATTTLVVDTESSSSDDEEAAAAEEEIEEEVLTAFSQ